MISKNHHYLPQAHLRRFSSREDGAVYCYDKRFGTKSRPKHPKGQGFAEHLYTYTPENGAPTSHIEDDILSKIDNDGAKAITAILQRKGEIDGADLAKYIASLILRNPYTIAHNQATGGVVLTEVYRRMYLYDPEFRANVKKQTKTEEEFGQLWKAASPEYAKVNMNREFSMTSVIQSIPKAAVALLNCDWHLLQANGESEFVISDVPAFTCLPSNLGKSAVGVLTPHSETILPISPKSCLLLTPGTSRKMFESSVSENIVSEINNRSAYSAQEKFYASQLDQDLELLSNKYPPRYPETSVTSPIPNLMMILREVDNQHFSPIVTQL